MQFILLTQQTGILGPFAFVLGKIFEIIYSVCSMFGIESIALCIVLFTLVVRLLMFPMTLKQQKFSKLSSVISPEIKAIQKKYENKKDEKSQLAMQQEMSAVYDKYGTSPTGGCLQLIIQAPILFALYRVIYNIPAYVGQVKEYYLQIIEKLSPEQVKNFFDISVSNVNQLTSEQTNHIIDIMSGYRGSGVTDFKLSELIQSVNLPAVDMAYQKIREVNTFFIYNLSDTPQEMYKEIGWLALLIPIAAGLFQFISVQVSTKMSMSSSNTDSEDNLMMSSMKTMNLVMPIMSIWLCWSFATGIGLYWVAGSLVALIQQLFIYLYFKKVTVEDIIKESQEKAKKKKKSSFAEKIIAEAAAANTKNIDGTYNGLTREEKEAKLKKAMEKYDSNKDKNSISSRANMVRDYNQRNKK